MKKVILHIPHSSTNIPSMEGYIVSEKILQNEIMKLTDWYTDDLFHSADDITVRADFSRILCDPERFPEDEKEVMAQFGMGVLYEKTDNGETMRKITSELRQKILDEYYWKHHLKLNNAVDAQLNQNGKVIIIDCHSYPDIPIVRSLDTTPNRPDFNIGTDSFHTPQKLIDISINYFDKTGYSLGIDWPYTGAIVPLKYYHQNKNVQSIMLEINRKLYLKDNTNEKSSSYSEIKKITQNFIKVIKEISY